MSVLNSAISSIGIDIGKNSFHLVGQDRRGAIVLRQKWSAASADHVAEPHSQPANLGSTIRAKKT